MHNMSPTTSIPKVRIGFTCGWDVSTRDSLEQHNNPTLSPDNSLLWEGEEAGYIQDPVQAV